MKYNFNTESKFKRFDILQHFVNSCGSAEVMLSYTNCLFFMNKEINVEFQKRFNLFVNHYFKSNTFKNSTSGVYPITELNLPCIEIGDMLKLDLNTQPYYFGLERGCRIKGICETFRLMFSHFEQEGFSCEDLDFMVGVFDIDYIYRSGRNWNIQMLFDSYIDANEGRPSFRELEDIDKMKHYISFAIRVHHGMIDLFAGKEAEEQFVYFHYLHYVQSRNRKAKFCYLGGLGNHYENIDVARYYMCNCDKEFVVKKKEPLLEQGTDYLKINLIEDRLVIVFNTSVPDNIWTVKAFKKIIKQALTNEHDIVDLGGLFILRQFDVKLHIFDKLLFSDIGFRQSGKPIYKYELNVSGKFENLYWKDNTERSFADEYNYFLKQLQKADYEKINQNSYQSLVYNDVFCAGDKDYCGYLVYRY